MPLMKIDNYEGSSDSFTFTYNPKVYETTLDNNFEITEVAFAKNHILISGEGISPRSFIITGHTSGANRFTDFRNLTKHLGQSRLLKKLYFESDKFAIVVGKQCKQVNDGERVMFIDYVAAFVSPIGLLFSDTQHSSGTNAGNAPTFIENITGTVTSSGVDITLTDGTNSYKISGGSLVAGDTVEIKLITMLSAGNGIYISTYRSATVNGAVTKKVTTTGGTGMLILTPGTNVSTITITNLSSASIKFRDAWFM